MLTASLELGVRHDGGDAETGFGADIGTSLALAAPPRELSAELRACGLLAQEADSLSRRGLSGTLAIDPAPDSERGLSLSLSQTVGGPASGGAGALLERPTLAGLGAETEEARLGYGGRSSTHRCLVRTGAARARSGARGWRGAFARRAQVQTEKDRVVAYRGVSMGSCKYAPPVGPMMVARVEHDCHRTSCARADTPEAPLSPAPGSASRHVCSPTLFETRQRPPRDG